MSERKVTLKGFLHKARIAKSALGFLATHREYLLTGEIAALTSPIVAKVDCGALMPTPALETIQNIVLAHMLASDIAKGEAAMAKANEPKAAKAEKAESEPKEPKAYQVEVFDGKGNIATRVNEKGNEEDIASEFDNHQRALEWADRRLFEGASDWTAQVFAIKLITANGPMTTVILRDHSVERILKVKRGPVMHKKPTSGSKLSFGCKVTNDVSRFSRG